MDLPHIVTGAAEVTHRSYMLNKHLLAHATATAGLAVWCEANGIGDGPIRAEVSQREVFFRGERSIGYRQVELKRGDAFLSAAEIRFRRDMLSRSMIRQLEQTDAPFGQVVAPLGPRRITTSARFSSGWKSGSVLTHHATVLDRRGRPIARVREIYDSSLVA